MVKNIGISNQAVRVLFLIFYALTILSEPHLSAQTQKSWQWVKQLGSKSWDISAGIVCNSRNKLFVAGSFIDSVNCTTKSVKSSGNRDMFISRFNENGDLEMLTSAGGAGNDMISCLCITPEDNLAMGGVISDSVVIGNIKIPGTGKRLFTAVTDANGTFIWIKSLAMTGNASLYLIGADSQGNIYISGTFTDTLRVDSVKVTSSGKNDIFLARMNKAGAVEKLYSFGGILDDFPNSIAADTSGNIIMAGILGKQAETDSLQTIKLHGKKTITSLIKFDRDFNITWSDYISSDDYCHVASLKYDDLGNIYTTGSFSSRLYFADTFLISQGHTDIFIIKYSSEGKPEWSKSFGSWYYDYASHLNVNKLGGAIITGSIGDTLKIDSLLLAPAIKNNSAFVTQFSSAGEAIWADCLSGNGNNFSTGSVLDNKGNLYFTGSFRDMFEKGDRTYTSQGDQDIFVAKYYNCVDAKAEISGQPSYCPGYGTELSVKRSYSNIVWNDTISNKYHITADKPGLYWVNMLDKMGCSVADTIRIIQNPVPLFSLGNDTTLLVNDSLTLKAPESYISYQWQDYSIEPFYLAKATDGKTGTEEYWLTVTDTSSCTYTDTVSITYIKIKDIAELLKVQPVV